MYNSGPQQGGYNPQQGGYNPQQASHNPQGAPGFNPQYSQQQGGANYNAPQQQQAPYGHTQQLNIAPQQPQYNPQQYQPPQQQYNNPGAYQPPQFTNSQQYQPPQQQYSSNSKPNSSHVVTSPKSSKAKKGGAAGMGGLGICGLVCCLCCCICCICIIVIALALGLGLGLGLKRIAACLNRPHGDIQTFAGNVAWANINSVIVDGDRTDVTFVKNETIDRIFVELNRKSATETGFEKMSLKVSHDDVNTLRIFVDSSSISGVNTQCIKGFLKVHLPYTHNDTKFDFRRVDLVEIKSDTNADLFTAKELVMDAILVNVRLRHVTVSKGINMKGVTSIQNYEEVRCVAPCTDGITASIDVGSITSNVLQSATGITTSSSAGNQNLKGIQGADLNIAGKAGSVTLEGTWTGDAKVSTGGGSLSVTSPGFAGSITLKSRDDPDFTGTITWDGPPDADGKRTGSANGGAGANTLTMESLTGSVTLNVSP
mmetsp:Transcript_2164/g.7888  ORF Transcript_2164/g.7888 Transcript_2164/m.7888 type:complete len:484 (-) Transcript_2164:2049-3500(-)